MRAICYPTPAWIERVRIQCGANVFLNTLCKRPLFYTILSLPHTKHKCTPQIRFGNYRTEAVYITDFTCGVRLFSVRVNTEYYITAAVYAMYSKTHLLHIGFEPFRSKWVKDSI